MSLQINTRAPDFRLKTAEGADFQLSAELVKGPVVLFFYPKDFTTGCTREVCAFRDDYSFFHKKGIQVVGISGDTISSHLKFVEHNQLPYTLLSDPEWKVARQYKAVYPFGLALKRITYLLSRHGIIQAVFSSMVRADTHIDSMKKAITAQKDQFPEAKE